MLLASAESSERTLEEIAKRGDQQTEPDESQQGNAKVAQESIGQVEEGEKFGACQDEDREACDQTQGDGNRPSPRLTPRLAVWFVEFSRGTGKEHDRQNGQDAR